MYIYIYWYWYCLSTYTKRYYTILYYQILLLYRLLLHAPPALGRLADHSDSTPYLRHSCSWLRIVIWLVVGPPLWKILDFVNWDDDSNPILMGTFKKWQPNHQPVMIHDPWKKSKMLVVLTFGEDVFNSHLGNSLGNSSHQWVKTRSRIHGNHRIVDKHLRLPEFWDLIFHYKLILNHIPLTKLKMESDVWLTWKCWENIPDKNHGCKRCFITAHVLPFAYSFGGTPNHTYKSIGATLAPPPHVGIPGNN